MSLFSMYLVLISFEKKEAIYINMYLKGESFPIINNILDMERFNTIYRNTSFTSFTSRNRYLTCLLKT